MRESKIFLWGGIVGYSVLFSVLSTVKYVTYSFHDFDLAVYAQGLWNFLHGSLESSILGVPLLGNHFVPILFLIAPGYALFPSPLLLLWLQTLFLALGANFIYKMARRKFPERLALAFSFSYLLYPALGYTNLFEFHPVAFAVFFLLGALDAFESSRTRTFLIFLGLASLCQEDVALALVMIGIYAFLQKRSWEWVGVPIAWGSGIFCLWVFKVMPLLNPQTIDFNLLYAHLGRCPLEVFSYLLHHPFQGFGLLIESPEKKVFILQLLGPLLFLPLLDPKSFLLSIPFFLEQLLSRRPMQHLIVFHYGALFIPFLYYAAIQGGSRLLRSKKFPCSPTLLLSLVLIATLAVNVWAGPHSHLGDILEETTPDLLDAKRELLVREIPKEASVMATFEFLSHLSNRKELYSLHHLYTKRYTLSEKEYLVPERLEYLLADFNDPFAHQVFYTPKGGESLRELLEKGPFRVNTSFEDLVLFEKGIGEKLFEVERGGSPARAPLAVDREGTLGLSRVDIAERNILAGEALPITFHWRCLGDPSRRYALLFEMKEKGQKKIRRTVHSFCYRLYPTDRWRKGEKIIEKYRLVFPSPEETSRSVWTVSLYLVDEKEKKAPLPFVSLGEFGVGGKRGGGML